MLQTDAVRVRVVAPRSRDFAGRFGLDFSMLAVVAVPFILYLVRFCSSKSCTVSTSSSSSPHLASPAQAAGRPQVPYCTRTRTSTPVAQWTAARRLRVLAHHELQDFAFSIVASREEAFVKFLGNILSRILGGHLRVVSIWATAAWGTLLPWASLQLVQG